MRKLAIVLTVLILAPFLVMNVVDAATVVYDLSEQSIFGEKYDVDFGFYYATTDIVPVFTSAEALGAMSQINVTLTTNDVMFLGGNLYYLLPLADYWDGTNFYCAASHYNIPSEQWVVNDNSPGIPTIWNWSDFSGSNATADIQLSSTVPIPGPLWLLGSGLIGIVGIRRKIRN